MALGSRSTVVAQNEHDRPLRKHSAIFDARPQPNEVNTPFNRNLPPAEDRNAFVATVRSGYSASAAIAAIKNRRRNHAVVPSRPLIKSQWSLGGHRKKLPSAVRSVVRRCRRVGQLAVGISGRLDHLVDRGIDPAEYRPDRRQVIPLKPTGRFVSPTDTGLPPSGGQSRPTRPQTAAGILQFG